MSESYDYIIVGGGTAGCVLANRLSADPDTTVLVLEAGDAAVTDAVRSPYRWNEVLLTELDWAYMSEPQPGLNGTQVYSAAGRGLGGTSNIYHMIHTRGRDADFERWVAGGATGWSAAEVLPYYQRLEAQRDDTNPTAGRDGPIRVHNAADTGNPVSQAFLDACAELGYPLVEDFNVQPAGAGWHHVDIDNDARCGARVGYLDPALGRPNLTTRQGATVGRLLVESGRCVGVEYHQDGRTRTVRCEAEVVLSAGAIQSPKVLMLSGIGDPDHLGGFGIPVVADVPGVGRNFQDHPLVIGPIGYLSEPAPPPLGNVTEAALFGASSPGLPVPDMEICVVHRAPFGEDFFANVIKRIQTGQPLTDVNQLTDPHVVLSLPGMVRPESRGWIRLAGTDPLAAPRISANYYAEPSDLDRTVTMVEIARDIYAATPFTERLGMTELSPGPQVRTRAELRDWVRSNTGSYYHFTSSCAMGTDPMAVVDPRLRVRGVEGLRVADASVMPSIVSANPHTTVLMIAERAAEFIAEDR